MSSDDSDCEEQKAALADALQCDFVQQAFDGKFTGEAKRANLPVTLDEDNKSKSNFEGIIAKILAERLDEKIKESKKGKRCIGKRRKQCGDEKPGIQMISKGRIVTGDDLLAIEDKKKNGELSSDRVKRSKKTPVLDSEEQYIQRAIESAVTPEWVCSDVNTRFWARKYQWRLIKMKKLKSLNDNGAILCKVLEEDS
uniref:Uncharacterized protein n=2 Tax=Rhodnius prolixus TaxID=13249 RepID=T1I1I1_RHOPR